MVDPHISAPTPESAGLKAFVTVNGQTHPWQQPLPLARLLAQLGVTGPHVAVEVNLQLIPRAAHATFLVRPGDQLEVVTLAGGG